ncbi:CaiB/BaiF CoA transferase family protein [Caldinitratiruptor microaerophilus]|uniref:CoA transferase n=1 Tax=Caldinitratiruptor microaerophilus TaxID=671077 RepID=A0AA35G791_9FIRM|nr:CaiB/BaiF CoA-transferase family protein [Caldinitratiruptor microaerophilus]BDG59570.1 CoA transferase [Caldinitratiruptor microaerophilus]
MRPLAGVRVLDLTRLLPGPYATRLLADLGAEVVKIEDPERGDYLRELQPEWFAWLNAGKRGARIDLKHPDGREVLLNLASRADALLEGFRPGVIDRLGLSPAALWERNPRLVIVSLSGYGADGPYRDRAGHDLNYLAASGLLSLFPPGPDGTPLLPPLQLGDLSAGLQAALAAVAGILHARTVGHGLHVDIPILGALWSLGGYLLAAAAARGGLHRSDLPLAGTMACYRCYRTADGGILSVGALEPRFWAEFCLAAGHPEWIARQNDRDQEALAAEVAAVVAAKPAAEWARIAAQVPSACLEVAVDPSAAPHHPQARALDAFAQGDVKGPRPPWRVRPATGGGFRHPESPEKRDAQGGTAHDILSWAGYDQDRIRELLEAGVVSDPASVRTRETG